MSQTRLLVVPARECCCQTGRSLVLWGRRLRLPLPGQRQRRLGKNLIKMGKSGVIALQRAGRSSVAALLAAPADLATSDFLSSRNQFVQTVDSLLNFLIVVIQPRRLKEML